MLRQQLGKLFFPKLLVALYANNMLNSGRPHNKIHPVNVVHLHSKLDLIVVLVILLEWHSINCGLSTFCFTNWFSNEPFQMGNRMVQANELRSVDSGTGQKFQGSVAQQLLLWTLTTKNILLDSKIFEFLLTPRQDRRWSWESFIVAQKMSNDERPVMILINFTQFKPSSGIVGT